VGKLEGIIALVTGGTSGIGLATAKQFVGEGAHVFVTGRREQELSAAARDIGGNVTTVQGDVSKLDDLDRRTVGMVECDVIDENCSLVARAASTCMTLRGAKANGR
jgi:NADP-dependent 3-hydroxy acid dehydrogenase YdfG